MLEELLWIIGAALLVWAVLVVMDNL